jgi:hypothetical protein
VFDLFSLYAPYVPMICFPLVSRHSPSCNLLQKNRHLLSSISYREGGSVPDNKKPPEGGFPPSFSRAPRAYRFPFGLALAPSRRLKGCRAGHRASSLTATLDSSQQSIQLLTYFMKDITPSRRLSTCRWLPSLSERTRRRSLVLSGILGT